MKISEFKQAIDGIGFYNGKNFQVREDDCDFCIENEDRTIATVSKSATCGIDTDYKEFREAEERLKRDLFDAIYEFAKTPPAEREKEKRYIVPLPHLVTTDGEQQYLTHNGGFFASRRDKELRQTWKEEHLKHIPEEYRKYAVEVKDEI